MVDTAVRSACEGWFRWKTRCGKEGLGFSQTPRPKLDDKIFRSRMFSWFLSR